MRILIAAVLAASLHVTYASAEVFDFTCGTIEFTVDFEESTVSDTIDGTASVDWQYDGDWVRWNVKDTDEFYGVNTKTGDLILDGVVNEAGCRMGDTSALATLPLSEGAYLRRAFIELPEKKRKEAQDRLSQLGYYTSEVDGKWGRGTEAAIKTYVAENQDEMPAADYSSAENAKNTLFGAMSHLGIDTRCDDCSSTEVSSAVQPEDSQNGAMQASSVQSTSQAVDTQPPTTPTKYGTFYFNCAGTDWNNDLSLDFDSSKFSGGFEHSNGFENAMTIDWEYDGEEVRFTPTGSSFEDGFAAFNVGSVALTRYVKGADGIFTALPAADVACRANGRDMLAKLPMSESRSKVEAAIKAKQLETRISEVTPQQLDALKTKCGEYLIISGLCWRQTFDDMKMVLTGRSYDCYSQWNDLAGVYGFKFVCEKDDAWVRVEENRINFSCSNFNICSYSVDETAQFIVNEGLVDTLKPDVEVVNGTVFKSYCGRGRGGEELCASESQDLLGAPTIVITLDRGASGEDAPSFD